MVDRGACLSSRGIRGLIRSGGIVESHFDESRIQPSSFDPTIGDRIFVLDTKDGLFRPREDEQVYRTLLKIPKRRRPDFDISDGYEVKVGASYLLPLEQRFNLGGRVDFLKSSPKSSVGRLFPNTRLLMDYSPSFDEAIISLKDNRERMAWILFQPLAFNLILSPGLSLNQLRFTRGFDSQLTHGEILELWKDNPLLYSEGKPVDSPRIAENLQIHANMEGKNTEGIVALRARRNPDPIYLRKLEEYIPEDYLEPIEAKDVVLTIERREHYLLSSDEVLSIPRGCSVELKQHSHQGISGPLHRAGFVDPGFVGDLVFELTSGESTDLELRHGTPLGELVVYRTTGGGTVYGKKIGSSYDGQQGPMPAKYFKKFDFKRAAGSYEKLDRDVLVQDANLLLALRKKNFGFESISDGDVGELIELIEKRGFFHSRYDCEEDELVLQVIPYVLGFGSNRTIFSYVRASDIKDYGDERLFGKHSVGLGGHIERVDGPNFVGTGLARELRQEVNISGEISRPILLGTLYQPDKSVDKVHFGMIYGFRTDGKIIQNESSIISGRMLGIEDVVSGSCKPYETWSRVLIPRLSKFYNIVSRKV
jgi:predicted NUDIX family phosphoesterase/deoxycytidine triphosphate deaminase